MEPSPMFKSLQLRDWQQYGDLQLDLGNRCTILTGVNGSGKTTILKILAYHQSEQFHFLATPRLAEGSRGLFSWFPGIRRLFSSNTANEIGRITFENFADVPIQLPGGSSAASYQLNIPQRASVPGFFIPSHRPLYSYVKVTDMSFDRITKKTAHQQYRQNMRNFVNGQHGGQEVARQLKNTVLNWWHNGYGKGNAVDDEELVENFKGFQRVLTKILPSQLGFKRYEVRNRSELVFVCENDTEFLLESLSGGMTSLLHLAWLMYSFGSQNQPYYVLIDEIENHLHPSMQRAVLPSFQGAFPEARFIVTTHSPHIVTSVRNAKIYGLNFNSEGRVIQHSLDFDDDPQTANEVLDHVLGVPVTMPLWAEQAFEGVINTYLRDGNRNIDLDALKLDLEANGLSKFTVEGLQRVLRSSR